MVEVIISRLGIDSATQQYVVVLQERGGDRYLPIWIGPVEADAIVKQVHNIKRPRPLTHDLCRSIIVGLGATLRRVQITRLEDNTYHAELHLSHRDGVVQIDARPSDSIAIALRLSSPIYVAEALLVSFDPDDTTDTEVIGEPIPDGEGMSAEQLKAHLEKLRPEDFGEFKL